MANKVFLCKDGDGNFFGGKTLTEAHRNAEDNGYNSGGFYNYTFYEATEVEVKLEVIQKVTAPLPAAKKPAAKVKK